MAKKFKGMKVGQVKTAKLKNGRRVTMKRVATKGWKQYKVLKNTR